MWTVQLDELIILWICLYKNCMKWENYNLKVVKMFMIINNNKINAQRVHEPLNVHRWWYLFEDIFWFNKCNNNDIVISPTFRTNNFLEIFQLMLHSGYQRKPYEHSWNWYCTIVENLFPLTWKQMTSGENIQH